MKVILVSPYSTQLTGGIISWTKYIVNYHREHGENINMHLLNNENALQVMGTTSLLKRFVNGINNYRPIIQRFKEIVRVEHFDVVHISTSASYGLVRDLLIILAAKKKMIKTVVHMHFGRIPQILETRGWEKFLLSRILKRVDGVIVMDKGSFNALRTAGYRNVFFLPNPLSEEVLDVIEKHKKQTRISRKIVFAGHVSEQKGVFDLVEACRSIKNVKVEILGKIANEEDRYQLIEKAGDNSTEWLSVPGNKSFEDVIDAMLTCNVFVLPSYSEGFPNVILESMACGCPIVATDVGAISEMLDVKNGNNCGICVMPKDVKGLKNAIEKMLDDREYAKCCGENAKKRVKELYLMPQVWNQLVNIWESL